MEIPDHSMAAVEAIVRLLDALVVKAEDVAETAASGASVEFANLVKEHLEGRGAAAA